MAAAEFELKTPKTPLADDTFRRDAVRKAQQVRAPFVALWNMRTLELYRAPHAPRSVLDDNDYIGNLSTISTLNSVEDWLSSAHQDGLKKAASSLLRSVNDLLCDGSFGGTVVDSTIFVGVLRDLAMDLRSALEPDIQRAMSGSRNAARELREWAQNQGLRNIVSDLNLSIAGQVSYRIAGQVLFYYAFRRNQSSLPAMSLGAGSVMPQLRSYWDRVRTFDYEALFGESILDRITFDVSAESIIRRLVSELSRFNWDDIKADVLGTLFKTLPR